MSAATGTSATISHSFTAIKAPTTITTTTALTATATKIEKNNKEPVGLNQNMYSDYFSLSSWCLGIKRKCISSTCSNHIHLYVYVCVQCRVRCRHGCGNSNDLAKWRRNMDQVPKTRTKQNRIKRKTESNVKVFTTNAISTLSSVVSMDRMFYNFRLVS